MRELNNIRILLVDDHAVVRAGYRTLLESYSNIVVVAEADSGELACQKFIEFKPDVVVMDLSLPGIGGLEAISHILSHDPKARILVFSMHDDIAFVEQALQTGARGYITKSDGLDILVEAVNTVASGRVYIDHALAQELAYEKSRNADSLFSSLSSREFEIFCLLGQGLSVTDIATRIRLGYKTVANYHTQIKHKLNVRSSGELIHLAIRGGLVNPDILRSPE